MSDRTINTVGAIAALIAGLLGGGLGSEAMRGPSQPQPVVDAAILGLTEALVRTHVELERCLDER